MMNTARTRCAFTATQWQELEHQALVFKYIVSGMPIPPDLLFAIKRSGWSYLQMGLGRKVDPEPGRCRRTDGKKWRCSRDAYPDSKYCERHMHRGKNRSRKPVESMTPSTPTAAKTATSSSSPSCFLKAGSSSSSISTPAEHSSVTHDNSYSRFGNPNFSNHFVFSQSSPSPEIITQNNPTQLLLDSESCAHTDYRSGYLHGGMRELDERDVFSHNNYSRVSKKFSSSSIEDPLRLTPLTINSSLSKQSTDDSSAFEHLPEKQHEDNHHEQHCYLLGRDLKSQTSSTMERNGGETWLNTQLSMSIPDSSLEFPIFNS